MMSSKLYIWLLMGFIMFVLVPMHIKDKLLWFAVYSMALLAIWVIKYVR